MTEAFDAVVRLLSRREHSAQELRLKLKQRGFSNDAIQDALMLCETKRLQSDARFAEMLYRSKLQRGYGPRVIRQLLKQAGVAEAVIEATFEEMALEVNWQAEVLRVWQKKYGNKADISPLAQQKQRQFLIYRGFPEATIKQFFKVRCYDENDE